MGRILHPEGAGVHFRDRGRCFGINQRKVRPIALADKSAVLRLEDAGRIMRRFFGNSFQGEQVSRTYCTHAAIDKAHGAAEDP